MASSLAFGLAGARAMRRFGFPHLVLTRRHARRWEERHSDQRGCVGPHPGGRTLGGEKLEVARKMRFGPRPLELERGDLGAEAVDDAFHLPRPRARRLPCALREVAIMLPLAPGRSRRGSDVVPALCKGRTPRSLALFDVSPRLCSLELKATGLVKLRWKHVDRDAAGTSVAAYQCGCEDGSRGCRSSQGPFDSSVGISTLSPHFAGRPLLRSHPQNPAPTYDTNDASMIQALLAWRCLSLHQSLPAS
ncbi:hypothetical protein L1887_62004 [Cichorium endivia]|nr:hypothetical protein L1887_62004 [Cichorium endivia]